METNSQKTEREEKNEKIKAILAVKFGTIKENSLLYWHYMTIKEEICF